MTPLNATYLGQKQREGFIKAWIIDNFSSKVEFLGKEKIHMYIMLPAAVISCFLFCSDDISEPKLKPTVEVKPNTSANKSPTDNDPPSASR